MQRIIYDIHNGQAKYYLDGGFIYEWGTGKPVFYLDDDLGDDPKKEEDLPPSWFLHRLVRTRQMTAHQPRLDAHMTVASRKKKYRERQANGEAILRIKVDLQSHIETLIEAGELDGWNEDRRVIEEATQRLLASLRLPRVP